jgi:hypothetical protein
MTQPRESNAVKSKIGKGTHGRLIPNARHPARVQDLGAWKKRRQRDDADEMVQIVHEGNVCRFLTALRISAPLSGDDQCRLSITIQLPTFTPKGLSISRDPHPCPLPRKVLLGTKSLMLESCPAKISMQVGFS